MSLSRALAGGRIIKTFAFRGATHLLVPEDGGAYLALRAAGRVWELPSWQSFLGPPPQELLDGEVARLATMIDRPRESTVQMA
jgi:hypothetical protein